MFTERRAGSRCSVRSKQAWPKGKDFRILSIDGGGIRGIFPAVFLEEIERNLGPVRSHFDLVAGTSTGGIIAIGIGLGLPMERIVDIYCKDGSKVFPPHRFNQKTIRFLRRLVRPLHDHEALETLLKDVFGERILGESECRLVIPAFVGPDPQIAVFKTDHHSDYQIDWQSKAWEIARATSAAPTFFAGHKSQNSFFLDGGVWANNPIMCAVVEAISAYEINPEQVRVLSIGTGNVAERLKESTLRAGMVGWRGIINTAMYLTTDSALSQAQLMLGHHRVLRVEPPNDVGVIEMDDYRTSKDVLPSLARNSFNALHDELASFFDTTVTPRERHYSS